MSAENVAYGLKVRGAPAADIAGKVSRFLGLVGLAGFERRRIGQLSGGQKQRVARAVQSHRDARCRGGARRGRRTRRAAQARHRLWCAGRRAGLGQGPDPNDPRMRLALGYAIDQKGYLEAAVGDPRFWRLCKTYFGCGTPLASDAGTSGLLEGNVEKAKALLKEAGYDGRPIVLLQVSDLASLSNLGPVAKAQLERVGFKVDMRPADWQSHLARVMRKEPPEDRGWNITLSSTGVLDVVNPVTSLFLNSACDEASAGWSCDAKIEELRDTFALESDAAKRLAIAEQIQTRAMELGTHYPLGEWYSASAVSTRTKGWLRPPSTTAFWNVEVTKR